MISKRRVAWRALPLVVLWLFACGGTSVGGGNEPEGTDPGGNDAGTGAKAPGGIAGNSGGATSGAGGNFTGVGGGFGGIGQIAGFPTCFEAGSLVATPRGSVAIEELRIGDQVLAFDEHAGSVAARRVTATFVHEVEESGRLALADGRVLRVTAEHPIYDAERGDYVRADSLDGNDTLVTLMQTLTPGETSTTSVATQAPSVGLATSDARGFFRRETGERVTVFNISVEGLENYFVEGVLVHNKSGAGNNCVPTLPPWTAGECTSQSTCLNMGNPELDDVELNEPAQSSDVPASPVSAPTCPNDQLQGFPLLAVDYRMPDTADGTPGFAVYAGDACSGTETGQAWLNDYEPPPLGSVTTQCAFIGLGYVPSNFSVHSLHPGGAVTNLRFVSDCACARELKHASTSCGPNGPRQCVNLP